LKIDVPLNIIEKTVMHFCQD